MSALTSPVPALALSLTRDSGRDRRFLFVLLAVNMHVLRNLPGLGELYLGVWGLAVAMVLRDLFGRPGFVPAVSRTFLLSWLVLGLAGFGASVAYISASGAAYGLARFWFAVPVYLALLAYVKTEEDLRRYTTYAVFFFAVAVATIPLQVVSGPIGWFHDASIRGSLARYPSMLGGLNAAGGAVGAYLLLAQRIQSRWRWPLTIAIAVSVMIDLSKSGVASIGVAVMMLLYLHRRGGLRLLAGLLLTVMVTGVALAALPSAQERLGTSLKSFGITTDVEIRNSDKSVLVSALDRLTSLPRENIEAWRGLTDSPVESGLTTLVGGGFGMASTALVPAGDGLGPQAHNQYVEVLTVFGVLGLLVVLATLGAAVTRLWRLRRSASGTRWVYLATLLLLTARFTFANGGLYHPATATALFLCLFASGLPVDTLEGRAPARRSSTVVGTPA
jgi:hypothetical protein